MFVSRLKCFHFFIFTSALFLFTVNLFIGCSERSASKGNDGIEPVAGGHAGMEPVAGGHAGMEPVAGGHAGMEPVAGGHAGMEPVAGGHAGMESQEEVYDCRDNDGDGLIDENLAPPISDRNLGVCRGSHKVCHGDRLLDPTDEEMIAQGIVGYETCEVSFDCLDNDCDGETDDLDSTPCPGTNLPRRPDCFPEEIREQREAEGKPLLFNDLDDPDDPTPCRPGLMYCRDGQLECRDLVIPLEEEICNNFVDDDCDGKVDQPCFGGPCREDEDCPHSFTQDGYAFSVRCDTSFRNGLCILNCDCRDCRFCILDNPDSPEQCDCEKCDISIQTCSEANGVCGVVVDPGNGSRPEACVRDCEVDGDCREGFECTDIHVDGEHRNACYTRQ